MRVYLHLSGEHPELPPSEAEGAFAGQGVAAELARLGARLAVAETEASEAEVQAAVGRLALTHEAGVMLYDGPFDAEAAGAAIDGALLAEATIAVRAVRLAETPWSTTQAERVLGKAAGRRVDLRQPTLVVRAFLLADRLVVGRRVWAREPKDSAARHVKNRPFHSPVSLDPKWTRALLNLARLGPGDLVVDPFCGTGGILIEAASMGFRCAGSDLDARMVEGAAANLAHYGLAAEALVAGDIVAAPQRFRDAGVGPADAVVSDLPYGRSASTGREARRALYGRSAGAWTLLVRPGGRVVVGIPDLADSQAVAGDLNMEAAFAVRVHRSLTRHFLVLARPE